MSLHNQPNFPLRFNNQNVDSDILAIEQDINEIELNLKSNYNSMIVGISDFKSQLDFYLNQLKECDQKISFLLNVKKTDESIVNQLQSLKLKLDNNKSQIALLLRIYDLKSKTKANKG